MSFRTNILIIDGDKNADSAIASALGENGCRVVTAFSGKEGLSLADSLCPDVILLELGLPDIDGFDVLQQLRSWSSIPIIVLSARTTVRDKVAALDLGADDYITKPFDTEELMARIRVALRHSMTSTQGRIYKALGLEIDFEKRVVSVDGRAIHLTLVEYQMLSLLAENSGKLVSYSSIMTAIWGPYIDTNNQILRVNVANIRRKIEKDPSQPQYIFTEAGVGYRMRDNENM